MNGESAFKVERLHGRHDREAFTCGVPALDRYLKTQAGQDIRKHAAVAFILTPDGKTVAGYYTLSQFSIEVGNLPPAVANKLARYPIVSATLIGRLAVSSSFKGAGLGHVLLMDALRRCLRGSHELASAAVIVDAKDAGAASFYAKYGFLPLPESEKRLFLPMTTVERMFSS